MKAARWPIWVILCGIAGLAGSAEARQPPLALAEDLALDRSWFFALGFELESGLLHPDALDAYRTLRFYSDEVVPPILDMNLSVEARTRLTAQLQVGVSGAFNGFYVGGLDTSTVGLIGWEAGGFVQYAFSQWTLPGDYLSEWLVRLEVGGLRSHYEVREQVDVQWTWYVQPEIIFSMNRGVIGMDLSFAWQYARLPDGMGAGLDLPHGGLIVRIGPHLAF